MCIDTLSHWRHWLNCIVTSPLQTPYVLLRAVLLTLCFSFVPDKRRMSLCVGCGAGIHDQYIMRVAPDLEWHAACLRCSECQAFLDESHTCFVRDGKTYCKRDYVRVVVEGAVVAAVVG
ncbi:Insulin gene enhancer protein ISL-1 [Frankliniella fusca]|uniref:Insulin gene enhancer protein ISL-1 n=1 Tax=Frankliniella fusca TaxID=407009 RepID=A0AAE1HPL0_9NEOP|nr:Insulin gene enhancer protein ISL-1 [Frankliniella fusca]